MWPACVVVKLVYNKPAVANLIKHYTILIYESRVVLTVNLR